MTAQRMSFRDLLAPVEAEDFLDRVFDNEPLHFPGAENRFDWLFSWQEANRLLDMQTVWSGSSLKVVLHGRTLGLDEYCTPRINRDGATLPQPDPQRIQAFIREGATVVLDFVEMLTPEIASVAAALQCWIGGETTCNVYCSWGGHQGFGPHFDTQDVFVLQIDGTKSWRVYEGKFDQAADADGYRSNDFSDDYHEKARGAVLREIRMTPGDVLYVPRGQYHDALAASDATLHLTFGVERLSGFHFFSAIIDGMLREPFLRQAMPTFEDAAAHRAYRGELSILLHRYMINPELAQAIRAEQRRRAFAYCYPSYNMPNREADPVFRVCGYRTRLAKQGPSPQLERPLGAADLSAEEASVAEWLLRRDYFTAGQATAAIGESGVAGLSAILDRFAALRFIERL